jgi:hypothetical protein
MPDRDRIAKHTALQSVIARAHELQAEDFHNVLCDDARRLVRLNHSALLRLDSIVRESLGSKREAGTPEIGGLLIGTVALDRSIVRLLDVVPIPSEYRFGPEFRPSDRDLLRFARAIAQYSDGPHRVLGYFRSHVGEPVSFRAEDEKLLRRLFGREGCSIILVHPDAVVADPPEPEPVRQVTVWFGQWDGGDNVRLLERLPLVTAQLTKQVRAKAEDESLVPQPAPQATRAPEINPPPADGESADGAGGMRLGFQEALIFATVLVVLGIFSLARLGGPRRDPDAPVSLGMTFKVHGGVVEVKWDAASPAVRDSDRGALDFADGPDVRRIELSRAQLRAGHFDYVPKEADIICVMTEHPNHNTAVNQTQSVHLDRPRATVIASLPQPTPAPPPAAGEKPVARRAVLQRTRNEALRIQVSSLDMPSRNQQSVPAPRVSFQPPSVVARATPTPRLEDPPNLAIPESSPGVSALLAPRLPSARFTSPPPEPADSPPVMFSAAVPITRASPVLSPAARSAIRQEVSLRVAVEVDSEGRVTGARPLDTANPVEKLLAPLAVEAARLWRFSPARRNGAAVASETVVGFQFGKNQLP